MTQKDLALASEVSPRHITDIEMLKVKPSFEVMEKLADVLGLELTYNLEISRQS